MGNKEIIEKKYIEAVRGIKKEWYDKADSKLYNYIINLPILLQITYLIVILDNQIFNGGIHQYFVNGYGQFAEKTIEALFKIGAKKKAYIIQKALLLVNSEQYSIEIFREKLLKFEIDNLFKNDNLFEPLDDLDSKYENIIDEDIETLLSEYIIKNGES